MFILVHIISTNSKLVQEIHQIAKELHVGISSDEKSENETTNMKILLPSAHDPSTNIKIKLFSTLPMVG